MRYAASTDDNQGEIVDFFRKVGFSVECIHSVGGGVPDLLLGLRNFNFLVEVKDGKKIPSKRRLNPAQIDWHEMWKGQKIIITSLDEAIDWSNHTKEQIHKIIAAGVSFQ